jgi:site-specific DNA-cytosine methylase
MYKDMLTRDHSMLPEHNVYVCGFPCKSFSSLRPDRSRPLQSDHAKPFFAMLRVLELKRPEVVVLENVAGIKAVMDEVLKRLRRLDGYFILVMEIDPLTLGEPVSRPRMYFLLIRQDAAKSQDLVALSRIATDMQRAASRPLMTHVADLMLPSSSPLVRAFLDDRQEQACATHAEETLETRVHPSLDASRRGVALRLLSGMSFVDGRGSLVAFFAWASQASRARLGVTGLPAPRTCFTTQRQVDVFRRALEKHRGQDVVVDVSQSVERAQSRADGATPTLTPNGIAIVQRLGRPIAPIEKLLLHGFPIDLMGIPADTKNSVLSRLGGNTMHLKAVSLAMLAAIALVDWGDRASGVGASGSAIAKQSRTPAAIFLPPPKRRRMSE